MPGFLRANEASVKQLLSTPGLIAGKELVDKGLTFWTLTIWRSDADMKSFRNSEAHRKAMQRPPDWCSEAAYFHWIQEETILPAWDNKTKRLIDEGRLSKVRKPSARHLQHQIPPIRWRKFERAFKAKT